MSSKNMENIKQRLGNLKKEWLEDSFWDLEEKEAKKDEDLHRATLIQKAKEIGFPGNLALASYVMHLEERYSKMNNKVEFMLSKLRGKYDVL